MRLPAWPHRTSDTRVIMCESFTDWESMIAAVGGGLPAGGQPDACPQVIVHLLVAAAGLPFIGPPVDGARGREVGRQRPGIAAVRRRRGRAAREAGRDLGLARTGFSAVSVPFQACSPGWAGNGIAS